MLHHRHEDAPACARLQQDGLAFGRVERNLDGNERGMESVGGGWGRARQGRHGRWASERVREGVGTRQLHSASGYCNIGMYLDNVNSSR